jgi:hypothetical protein
LLETEAKLKRDEGSLARILQLGREP